LPKCAPLAASFQSAAVPLGVPDGYIIGVL
jgi:hypothetical protein